MTPGRPDRDYDPTLPEYPTIVHTLIDVAARVPDRTAIIDGDRSITFAQYQRAVAAYAHRLSQLNAGGGRVAILMRNSIEVAVVAMAAMTAMAQAAPLNFNYPEKALAPLVADVDPAIIVADAHSAEMARAIASELGIAHVDVFAPGAVEIDPWINDHSIRMPERLPWPEDPSVLFFTGGTTGLPKAADHCHANDMAYVRANNTMWRVERDAERFLNVAPNFHIWGFCKSFVTPLYMGAAIDLLPEYHPAQVLKRIETQGITVFAGGPAAMYVGLRANEHYKSTDFSRLKYCFTGGSPCPGDLHRSWEAETGCPILEGWGMSEGSPCNHNPLDGVRKIGSVGLTPPRTEIDIVDLETGTKIMPVGERGEIRIRGPQFVKGYRNRPRETAEAFRDGWLYTGDIGRFDEDGYAYLVDRKKEMIIVGGYNVYPREIDEVLNNHPAVMEAATIGIPDSFRGEAVKACVALNPGVKVTADDLLAYCKANLVKYKVPTAIEFFPQLPKTGPGKIDKLKLKGLR